VGSRQSIGGGILPSDPSSFQRFITHTDAVKPGVFMPAFGMLPPEDVRALAAYMADLK
jgi:cytochrome c oxidase subunit II